MRRRHMIGALGVLGAAPFAPAFAERARSERLAISNVEIWEVAGPRETEPDAYQAQVTPLHIYPEHALGPYPEDPRVPVETVEHRVLYVKVKTDSGEEGLYGLVDRRPPASWSTSSGSS